MEYRDFITPNDDDVISSKDYLSIQNAIQKAKETGCNKVVVPRFNKRNQSFLWEIESSLKLPSDIWIILDNCHLKMADNTICNMITNENCRTPEGNTQEGTQRNIIIEGRGRAVLDVANTTDFPKETTKTLTVPFPWITARLCFLM